MRWYYNAYDRHTKRIVHERAHLAFVDNQSRADAERHLEYMNKHSQHRYFTLYATEIPAQRQFDLNDPKQRKLHLVKP